MDNLKLLFLISAVTIFLGSLGLLAYHYILLSGQLLRLGAL